jgi:release factor glutamine methyltransferase
LSVPAIGELIERAATRLRTAGVTKPRREAHRLWAWMNRTTPSQVYFGRDREADAEVARAFEDAVARRAAGEPLAYLLGSIGFRRLELRCDRRALIPRPESESLVDLALARVRTGRALDLGTGTGCLALALAQEGAFSEIVATDLSEDALALARENAALTGLSIRLVRSDLGTGLAGEQFDLVVSNPPYISEPEYAALDDSVKAWEPAMALVSGPDGLAVTRRMLGEARSLVLSGGWLVMELDSSRCAIAAECAGRAGWTEIDVHDDLFGRPRYLTARQGLAE